MTKKPYWDIDRVLIRAKDFIIVGSAIWAIFVVGVKFYPLPGEVEAQAKTINDHELRIQKVEDGFSDVHEIKELLLKKAVQQSNQ